MSSKLAEITQDALRLPHDEQLRLARALLESSEATGQLDVDGAWEEEIERLPVVAGDRLVGICTRTDILRARRRQFEHERAQKGWRPRFRSSVNP